MFGIGFIFDPAREKDHDPADQKNSSKNSRQNGDVLPVRFWRARRSSDRIQEETKLKEEQENPKPSQSSTDEPPKLHRQELRLRIEFKPNADPG
jgi:hypothetical protein